MAKAPEVPEGKLVDRDGRPVTLLEWGRLFDDPAYALLAEDTVTTDAGPITITTRWHGVNNQDDVLPFITSTRQGRLGRPSIVRQYPSMAAARTGHPQVVEVARTGVTIRAIR